MTAGEEQSRSPADAQIVSAAQLACLLEVTAPKPGNVSPGRHFADARFEDFLASAAAIGPPLVDAPSRPLGLTIRLAVEATSAWSGSNTNLGLILLLAPLVKAASIAWRGGRGGRSQSPGRGGEWSCDHATLRAAVRGVLEETSVDDAREVMHRLDAVGIDMDDVGLTLESQGVASFHESFRDVLGALDAKAHQLAIR